ncbi:MAG TPA: CDP-alcohol phosphatidyltransferase family protein [Candidatus Bathyarchaeia archaeon]|nr:CDP-alcohol phosphatidyltransferase family protein [Candidatus Bathyarchaeia archaeon]
MDLVSRLALAANRAGYGLVCRLAPTQGASPEVETVAGWEALASRLENDSNPCTIASTELLAEAGWLKALLGCKPGLAAWAAAGDRLAVITPASLQAALSALADARAGTMAAAVEVLTRKFDPPGPLPKGVDPMAVTSPGDEREAERRLMRALVKDTDGFMAKHVERPISLAISRLLAATWLTANQMTLFSVAVGLLGAPFFLASSPIWQTIGALLFLAHSILDGCDGELARLKFQESRWGGILDFWGDNVVHSAIFACMAIGWSAAAGSSWPLLPGAAAVLGTLGSASFVYWRTMRAKRGHGPLYTSVSTAERRTARLLDALSRRDFIYLVLALSLFGRADWFLILAALGAPIFFAMLVYLAASERPAGAAKPRKA